jgi:hypothetical protein
MVSSYRTRINSNVFSASATTTIDRMIIGVLAFSTSTVTDEPSETPEILSPGWDRLPVLELPVTQQESPPQTPNSPFGQFPFEDLAPGPEIAGEFDFDLDFWGLFDFSNVNLLGQQQDGLADLPEAQGFGHTPPLNAYCRFFNSKLCVPVE